MANATFLDSEATYPTRPGETVPFIGQSDVTGNVGLTYEKAGFFARLALNLRSERLRQRILEVRAQGWALVDQELAEGLISIAAPVKNAAGRTVAALNISGQANRTSAELMQQTLLPPLLRRIRGEAPGVVLVPRAWRSTPASPAISCRRCSDQTGHAVAAGPERPMQGLQVSIFLLLKTLFVFGRHFGCASNSVQARSCRCIKAP